MPKSYSTNKQICQRYGDRSHTWLWRLRQNDPRFPKPVLAGSIQLTDDDELDRYDEARAVIRQAAERKLDFIGARRMS